MMESCLKLHQVGFKIFTQALLHAYMQIINEIPVVEPFCGGVLLPHGVSLPGLLLNSKYVKELLMYMLTTFIHCGLPCVKSQVFASI